MSAHLLESDLDLPAADEQSDDVLWLGVEIGCEEGLRVELAGWIADQKPSDRHRRHAAAIPNGGAGCALDQPVGSAVPQADAATLPRDFAILDEGGKLLVGLALDRSPAAAFALLRGKLEQ